MRQRAVVVEVNNGIAVIEVRRSSMCEGCHKMSGCGGHCDLSGIIANDKKMRTKARNVINAGVGDLVEIESEDKKVLGYAALVFILPILICAAFYFIGSSLLGGEVAGLICAAAGFVITFVLIAAVDRAVGKKAPDIVIVGKVLPGGDNGNNNDNN